MDARANSVLDRTFFRPCRPACSDGFIFHHDSTVTDTYCPECEESE